jgi:hypothetical protein
MSAPRSRTRADFRIAGGMAGVLLLLGSMEAAGQPRPSVAEPAVPVVEGATLQPAHGWPVWIKDRATGDRAEKTSDIVFAGRETDGARSFFLADEVGLLRWCRVSQRDDTGRVALRLERVAAGGSFSAALRDHDVWDFEALALVPHVRLGPGVSAVGDSIEAWLSLEGHGNRYRAQTNVFGVVLQRQRPEGNAVGAVAGDYPIPTWRLEARGEAFPRGHFWNGQVGADRGIAGIGIAPRMAYLGLSRGDAGPEISTAGTVIYVYDRGLRRVAYVGTRRLGIYGVGGIDAWSDTLSVVLDRERASIFVLRWDAAVPGEVTEAYRFPLDLPGPGGFRYAIPRVEGVAVDDAGDLWCVTDPERGHYRAEGAVPESVLVYLAAEIPMLYRFPGEQVWNTVGVQPSGGSGK